MSSGTPNQNFMTYCKNPDKQNEIMTFQQIFRISPETMSLFCKLAYHQIEHEDYEKGEQILMFLLHLNCGITTIWSAMATCYLMAGDPAKAIDFCSKWDQYWTDIEGEESPLPLIYQASCHKENGEMKEALKLLRSAENRLDNIADADQKLWCQQAIDSLRQPARDT